MKTANPLLFLCLTLLPADAESLRVLMFDYAGLDEQDLKLVREVVSCTTRQMGHEVEVLDCRKPECELAVGCTDFTIRAMGSSPNRKGMKGSLGLSFSNDGCGGYANVYVTPIARIAAEAGVSRGRLIGYAVAHELVHLLTASNRHSRDGVMKPRWGVEEARRMGRGDFRLELTGATR
jgi:hypothetical protein